MLKQALIVASVLSVLLVLGVAGFAAFQQRSEFEQVRAELEELRAEAEARQGEMRAEAAQLGQELTNSQARIEVLMREKKQVEQAQSKMEEQMRAAMQSKDVTISELQGKLTVNILDRVLFDSGEAQLKPEGEKVLDQLAAVLIQHTNRQVYVIGHTDNVPMRAGGFSRYGSNWELSTARATAAVRHLTERAAVNPRMLAAVGYGEFHPVADNATAEGRARNRRIAIVILPEQFNPLDMRLGTNGAAAPRAGAMPLTNAAPAITNAPPPAANGPAEAVIPEGAGPSRSVP